MTPELPTDLWATHFPTAWPASNALVVFGVLLVFGVLGGMLAARLRGLPTITGFMAFGLLIGPSGLGLLSQASLDQSRVLVDIALGLILFRLGSSIHPVLALRNRALVLTSLAESLLTFALIAGLLLLFGATPVVAALAGAIAVSSSPAVLIHVAHELKAEGPTVDAAEALVASNNVLSFLLFSFALPLALYGEQFELSTALLLPTWQMLGAVAVSIAVAWVVTRISRMTRRDEEHFRFALVVGAVMLALGLAVALKVSGLFAGLALGLASRWLEGRTRLSRVEFGGGADVFFIVLFVFAGANLHLGDIWNHAGVALAFVAVRTLAKLAGVYGCGVAFGHGHRRPLAAGMMLVPMAGLAIGLVQSLGQLAPGLAAQMGAIVLAAVAVFETVGPPLVAYALRLSGEAGAGRKVPRPGNGHGVPEPAAPTAPTAGAGAETRRSE